MPIAQDKVRGYYHHYNLYYTLHLVVLGYEQEAVRAGLRRCTDQFLQGCVKCQKSNILIGGQKWSATSATCKPHWCQLDGASQKQVGNLKQLAPACSNTTSAVNAHIWHTQ
jgi:hypothetical protein